MAKLIHALFIFLLLSTVQMGPAAPGCWMGCHSMCLLSGMIYFLCMPPCIALCSATCFSEDTLVILERNGFEMKVPISTIKKGDFIK